MSSAIRLRVAELACMALPVLAAITLAGPVGCSGGDGDAAPVDKATVVGDNGDPDGNMFVPVEDEATGAVMGSDAGPVKDASVSMPPPKKDTQMQVTGDLNLRSSPQILPDNVVGQLPRGTIVTLKSPTPTNGFYNVDVPSQSKSGWCSGKYLIDAPGSTPSVPGSADGPPTPDNALARAKLAMGYSYYWGGGAWTKDGVKPETKGSCSGNCPSCSHKGKFGADCSGFVAKVWQYGAVPLEEDDHPFSTADFVAAKSGYWKIIDRGEAKLADSAVYREGGGGHIVMYEKGDAWNSPYVYECTGCDTGCIYGVKKLAAKYKMIRREGFN
jgi:cell wall-associated NlpC family hydrolase